MFPNRKIEKIFENQILGHPRDHISHYDAAMYDILIDEHDTELRNYLKTFEESLEKQNECVYIRIGPSVYRKIYDNNRDFKLRRFCPVMEIITENKYGYIFTDEEHDITISFEIESFTLLSMTIRHLTMCIISDDTIIRLLTIAGEHIMTLSEQFDEIKKLSEYYNLDIGHMRLELTGNNLALNLLEYSNDRPVRYDYKTAISYMADVFRVLHIYYSVRTRNPLGTYLERK